MRRVILVVGASLLLALAAQHSASAGVHYHNCGSFGVKGLVKAHHTRCPLARKVIKGFYRKAQASGPRVRVKGFACRGRVLRNGIQDVRCNRHHGRNKVHYRGSIS